jgi:hypothetical protein
MTPVEMKEDEIYVNKSLKHNMKVGTKVKTIIFSFKFGVR